MREHDFCAIGKTLLLTYENEKSIIGENENRICTVMHRGGKHEKVVKFGGSSLASAEQFKKVGDIIRSDESRRYVVPSAPGKRFDGDIKVTDMLYECYRAAEKVKRLQERSKKSRRDTRKLLTDWDWI